jgi:MFS family permease
MSTQAPGWAQRFGRGPVGGAGLALMGAGCFAFAVVDGSTSYWWFAGALAVFGAGMGLAAPPATEAIVEALPRAQQGVASATNDVARELGGAIGIALIGSTLTSGYRGSIDDAAALPAEVAPIVRDSAPAGLQAAASATDPATVVDAVRSAVTDGFSQAMVVAGALLVIGAAYVARMTPRPTAAVGEA